MVRSHNRYRTGCINLIPSENVLSPQVLEALSSDLAGRYAFRPEFYGGTGYAHRIWEECEMLASQVFDAEYCDVTPLSGHIALMIALYTVAGRGGTLARIPTDAAGYPGLADDKIPEVFGMSVVDLPYREHMVDVGASLELLRRKRPDVVVLGASLILYPHPVKELADTVHSYGGRVIYDGSHVLGLIAGGRFQEPLKEGADILLGSTHKSFPGPQGAIISTNDKDLARRLQSNTLHKFVDNIHLNRVAALAVSLEEMRRFGRQYAGRVISNAKSLAYNLEKAGFKVFKTGMGYTMSHQVYIPMVEAEGVRMRDKLEKCRIIVDMAVRMGTNEVSRRGMTSAEMGHIARLVERAVSGEDVSRDAVRLAKRFKRLRYTL
ncbi:MAG: aminotransferase class I/II-fold pyridoxal phosphate-dependent enzyme [Nitrososphaerota archaeon]